MKGEFLFEIGCEEIPAGMLEAARHSLQVLLEEELRGCGLLLDKPIVTYATPRRLVATCERLAPAEPDRVNEVVGPPEKVAFDADGKPSRAAGSFAQKQGVKLGELTVVETPRGRYLAAVARQKGRPAPRALAALLPSVVGRISFPRTMYWTSPQGLRFIRPIRWLVALYDGRVIPFELDGLRSGETTRGHRLLADRALRVRTLADYHRKLAQARVVVDCEQRRRSIERDSERLLEPRGLCRRADSELLDAVVNLVEHPAVVLGDFSPDFLSLPPEILVTVMRHHQKYFSVEDKRGRLTPHFLAVIDLDADRSGEIRRGHEAVLGARFRDAQFFWQADEKRRLAERLPLLDQAVFVSGLGTYREKTTRLTELAAWLGENLAAERRRADINALTRAAELAKADLTTEMVGEFPELQGIVGGLYARAQGEDEKVADAIYEHYLPAGVEDALPRTLEGALLSVADKLDSVAGCFAVGYIPSGSRDPYALRRAANGVVRILVEQRIGGSLAAAIAESIRLVGRQVGISDPHALASSVKDFFRERTTFLFRDVRRLPYDEVNAVLAAGWHDLPDAVARLEALHRIRPSADFEPLAVAFKRIRNILEQAGALAGANADVVEQGLLEAGPERELHRRFLAVGQSVAELRRQGRYEEALRQVASLRPQVDRFFDKVLVMAEEEALRRNRLRLLAGLLREFSTIADFSEIVITPKQRE